MVEGGNRERAENNKRKRFLGCNGSKSLQFIELHRPKVLRVFDVKHENNHLNEEQKKDRKKCGRKSVNGRKIVCRRHNCFLLYDDLFLAFAIITPEQDNLNNVDDVIETTAKKGRDSDSDEDNMNDNVDDNDMLSSLEGNDAQPPVSA